MDPSFKELKNLLAEGPVPGKEKLFSNIFEVIFKYTGCDQAIVCISDGLLQAILQFTGHGSPYNSVIYKILINIFSDDKLNERNYRSTEIRDKIINLALSDILNENSKEADHASMLLSNITRSQNNCKTILELDKFQPFSDTIKKIVSVFTIVGYNRDCSLDQLAMVLCNFSQLAEIRNILTENNICVLGKLVPFTSHESTVRRRGIIGVLHNCVFDSNIHQCMLKDDHILSQILLPLAGPEEFDDDDNDKLPIDLQYLPHTKSREQDPEIRTLLLETLNQLCATKFGRQFLRDHNAYIILRELHKWEQDPFALQSCENVVDILIRTEDEIGIDHLKSVEIPKDVEDIFTKEMTN